MNQLDFVMVKKTAKEYVGWETKPTLKGGEHQNFVGVQSRNVFIFRQPPLGDSIGREKMILDKFEELTLIDGGGGNISG
jgi:hypothetical protein